MRRTLLLLTLTIALVASACSGDDAWFTGDDGNNDGNGGTSTGVTNSGGEVVIEVGGEEIVLASGLSGFDDCDALLDHVRTEAAERVGPYGFNGGGWYFPGWFGEGIAIDDFARDGDVAEEATADFADSGGDDSARFSETSGAIDGASLVEGVDFSGTNVQEIGVDEADLVKTDGERVFILANNELTIVDVNMRSVVASMDLVDIGWNAEMFLLGDEVLLVSQTWGDFAQILPVDGSTNSTGDAEAEFADVDGDIYYEEGFYETSMVNIARISVAGNNPELREAMLVEGEYVSARSIDGVARVIIRSSPQQNFPFVYPQSEKGEDVATEANQNAVRNSELTDWLPSYVTIDEESQATDRGILSNCGQVHAPTEFAGFGVLTVLSVPVDGDINPNQNTSVLAPGNTVYASTESIYVATQTWVDPIVFDDDEDAWQEAWNARQTSIHRFALAGDGAAYTASGSVAGDVRDQFSFSEYDGHLRVITTTGESWDESSETFVRVLREAEGELREVGSVGDMGNGEAVQSVRMIGDVGYVVTFRQVDPFYTLDLSDPESPRVVGELKIPGFSSYLHPIGAGRVLGVGSDGTDDGRITGSKVSIFDVSNPADPQEVAIWTAPDGWTDVGWDHRSFLWWEAEQLAVVPVQIWSEGWAGAVVLKVEGNEIREVGRIDHIDEGDAPGSSDCDRLTAEDLPGGSEEEEFDTELQWMLQDDYSRVLICGPDDSHKASGFECYDEPYFAEEADRIGLDLPSDSSLVICWRNEQLPVIGRTLVVDGDELWSISGQWGLNPQSPARVQLNDLFDLDLLETIQIG